MYNKEQFEAAKQQYLDNPKLIKQLNIDSVINLMDLLERKEIKDEKIIPMLTELAQLLETYDQTDKDKRKDYKKAFSILRNHAAQIHKLQPKGTYSSMGIAIGSGVGVALTALDSLGGAGLAIGIGIGIAIGYGMESSAEKEDRLY